MVPGTAKRFACVVALLGLGCTVTEDEVRSYSRYSNGRAKLFAVLIGAEFDVKLRTVAAIISCSSVRPYCMAFLLSRAA